MPQQQQQEDDDPVVAAIERVLKVERDGAEQLRRSQEHAVQLLDQARAQAAIIAAAADTRISRLYANYLQKIERDVAKLAEASRSPGGQLESAFQEVTLAQAVRRVAAKLTGGA